MAFDRQTPEYRNWRRSVIFRDGFKCVHCGSPHNLEAHHILPVAKHPEKALDVDNGITLCTKCHYEEHNKNYSDNIVNTTPSLIDNLHPFFIKVRKATYYISYRSGILKKFWKEFPLPRRFKQWLTRLVESALLLLILIIASSLRGIF